MNLSTEILAIIPARGGSKSIPRKNVIDFAGHPLIAYSIAAGLAALSGRTPREVPIADLQQRITEAGGILEPPVSSAETVGNPRW